MIRAEGKAKSSLMKLENGEVRKINMQTKGDLG